MIDSPSNPTVKMLRSLETPRGSREHGLFVVEGVRLLEDALASGRVPRVCLYTPALLSRTERGGKLLGILNSAMLQKGSEIVEASERALSSAANTQHPQGVVAAFEIPKWPEASALKKPAKPHLALVCDDIQDPGNLGTILRTSAAAGVSGVWLSQDCAYAFNPKVVRAAMGAHFRLPIYPEVSWQSIAQDLEDLAIPPGRLFATDARAVHPYDQVNWTLPSALIVSNEAHGLSESAREFLNRAKGSELAIPMLGGTESLNASIAAAVILFEAARQRRAGRTIGS